jgi:hypothetical protein
MRELGTHNCDEMKFQRKLNDGTLYCAVTKDSLNTLRLNVGTGWEFIISKSSYQTPLGQTLMVQGIGLGEVQVRYLMAPDIELHYWYGIPPSVNKVDPEYMIAVDRSVLQAIRDHQIANYSWPKQQTSSNSGNGTQ